MRAPLDPYASMSVVLCRIVLEVAAVADEFALIETAAEGVGANLLRFDSMAQRLRAIEAFIAAIAPGARGEVQLGEALEAVPLEAVRARLAGEQAAANGSSIGVEIW